ncbi:MAG: TauD/TfdA family dioxygenase [Granulosicoccus sp.]
MQSRNVPQTLLTPLPPCYDGRSEQYIHWRSERLHLQKTTQSPCVLLTDKLTNSDNNQALVQLCEQVRLFGFAHYRLSTENEQPRQVVAKLATTLGLHHCDTGVIQDEADQLSLLENHANSARSRFLPYSNKAMNWHTDGYYNAANDVLRSFTLHCLQSASTGGTLTVMDPELLLIALYDEDPQLVLELTHKQAMLLPANVDAEGHDRPDRRVPVLFAHEDESLGLRYTTRSQHIQWRSEATRIAAERALELIELHDEWHTAIRLQPGEGIVSRNVLHRRDAFDDESDTLKRQMLRGRYLKLPTVSHTGAFDAAR